MKKLLNFFILLLLVFVNSTFAAPDLWQVYQTAFHYDPTLRSNKYTRLATHENTPIQRANLLPTISASASRSNDSNDITLFHTGKLGNSYSLTITQTIFNLADWLNYAKTSLDNKAADASYGAAVQDLIQRTTTAYFNQLQATDSLNLAIAEKKDYAYALGQTKLRYHAGLAQITDVDTAQAQYDNSINSLISAQKKLTDSMAALHSVTGIYYPHIASLQKNILMISPNPQRLDQWLNFVRYHNLNVLADRYAAQSARENIKVQAAGHLPTVSANVAYSYNPGNDVINTNIPLNNKDTSVGLTLNFPIFSGGQVVAQTHQAQYNFAKALAQTEIDYQTSAEKAQQSYFGVIDDIKKFAADSAATISTARSLRTNRVAYQAGTKTILDVLTAQQTYYDSREKLIEDKYAYLIDSINLKEAAGTLSLHDLVMINQYL